MKSRRIQKQRTLQRKAERRIKAETGSGYVLDLTFEEAVSNARVAIARQRILSVAFS